jgi:hypothetical protein
VIARLTGARRGAANVIVRRPALVPDGPDVTTRTTPSPRRGPSQNENMKILQNHWYDGLLAGRARRGPGIELIINDPVMGQRMGMGMCFALRRPGAARGMCRRSDGRPWAPAGLQRGRMTPGAGEGGPSEGQDRQGRIPGLPSWRTNSEPLTRPRGDPVRRSRHGLAVVEGRRRTSVARAAPSRASCEPEATSKLMLDES